jgi:predicted nucleotidyltransferase
VGYRLVSTVDHDVAKRLATARLASPAAPDEELIVDVLFASSGVEPEIAARAEPLEVLDGLVVPVAAVGDLLALKLLSRDDDARPQDALDLRALRAAATPADVALARQTAALIADRGYARGRDLAAALRALLAEG